LRRTIESAPILRMMLEWFARTSRLLSPVRLNSRTQVLFGVN
jgi:hypothetical protein